MADQSTELKSLLDASGAPDQVKAQAWSHFWSSANQEAFERDVRSLSLPDTTKRQMWDLRFPPRAKIDAMWFDPAFHALAPEDRRSRMALFDPDFAALSKNAQERIVRTAEGKFKAENQPKLPTIQQESDQAMAQSGLPPTKPIVPRSATSEEIEASAQQLRSAPPPKAPQATAATAPVVGRSAPRLGGDESAPAGKPGFLETAKANIGRLVSAIGNVASPETGGVAPSSSQEISERTKELAEASQQPMLPVSKLAPEGPGKIKSFARGAASAVERMTTPETAAAAAGITGGLAAAPAFLPAAAVGALNAGLSGYFAYQFAHGATESAKSAFAKWRQGDYEGAAHDLGVGSVPALLALVTGSGAFKSAKETLKPPPKASESAESVPRAEPPPTAPPPRAAAESKPPVAPEPTKTLPPVETPKPAAPLEPEAIAPPGPAAPSAALSTEAPPKPPSHPAPSAAATHGLSFTEPVKYEAPNGAEVTGVVAGFGEGNTVLIRPDSAYRRGGRAGTAVAVDADKVESLKPSVETTEEAAPAKPLHEMSPEELDAAHSEAQAGDQQLLVRLFGEDGARQYQKLQRTANGSGPNADSAAAKIEEMESTLSPEQQNKLFGIGEEARTPEQIGEYRDALRSLDWDSPEALGESLKWAVTKVGRDPNPAHMDPQQLVAYAQIKHAYQQAAQMGWDTGEVSRAALRGAAERFSDKEDAQFMLEHFAEGSRKNTREPSAVSQEQITTTPPALAEAATKSESPPSTAPPPRLPTPTGRPEQASATKLQQPVKNPSTAAVEPKPLVPEKAPTTRVSPESISSAIAEMADAPGNTVTVSRLREKFPESTDAELMSALNTAAADGSVILRPYEGPRDKSGPTSPGMKASDVIRGDNGELYVGAARAEDDVPALAQSVMKGEQLEATAPTSATAAPQPAVNEPAAESAPKAAEGKQPGVPRRRPQKAGSEPTGQVPVERGPAQGGGNGRGDGGNLSAERPDLERPDGSELRGKPAEGVRPQQREVVTVRPDLTPKAPVEKVPANTRKDLKPFQQEGVALAIQAMEDPKRGGFLLADGPGAGKSLQALSVATHFTQQGSPVVIVAPSEVLKFPAKGSRTNVEQDLPTGTYAEWSKKWGIETRRFDPDRHQTLEPGKVYFATYNNLDRVPVDKNTILIADESHALKGIGSSQRAEVGQRQLKNAKATLFMSATPADKPSHIQYLAKIGILEGQSPRVAVEKLGMTLREGVTKDGKPYQTWEIDRRVGAEKVQENFENLFDRMIANGSMVKREIPLDGYEINIQQVKLPDEAKAVMDKIYDELGRSGEPEGLALANILMHQRRQQETYKIDATTDLVKKEIAEGRKVIVFMSRVNRSDVIRRDRYRGPDGEMETVETVVHSSEGTAPLLKQKMIDAGIAADKIVELHGAAKDENGKKMTAARAMKAFNQGEAQVLNATIESGGTGLNLDDVVGDQPRTIIIMTSPFDATGLIQGLGRIHRLSTKSAARAHIIMADTPIDDWNGGVIQSKLKTLGAVVKGAVKDIQIGRFEDVGANIPEGLGKSTSALRKEGEEPREKTKREKPQVRPFPAPRGELVKDTPANKDLIAAYRRELPRPDEWAQADRNLPNYIKWATQQSKYRESTQSYVMDGSIRPDNREKLLRHFERFMQDEPGRTQIVSSSGQNVTYITRSPWGTIWADLYGGRNGEPRLKVEIKRDWMRPPVGWKPGDPIEQPKTEPPPRR